MDQSNTPEVPQSENGGPSPELAAACTAADAMLTRFRDQDQEWARGQSPRPDYQARCYELAASLHKLLTILGAKQ